MPLDFAFEQEAREQAGRWFPLPENIGGEFFGVYPLAVKTQYIDRLQKVGEQWRKEHGKTARKKNGEYQETIPLDEQEKLTGDAMAGCLVRKIRGVVYQGKELESTLDNLKLLLSTRMTREHCKSLLYNEDNYSPDVADDLAWPEESIRGAEGNSPGGSRETSTTAASSPPSND